MSFWCFFATRASRPTIEGLRYVYPPEVELYRRWAPCVLRYFEVTMPAIASLEDLKSAQKDLLEAKDLNELKAVFKKWRRIGWKNVCGAPMGKGRAIQKLGEGDIPAQANGLLCRGKLWLEERSPEQLKGEGG